MVAFGSRATWTAKEYSDLDLAVLGDEPLPLDAAAALAEGFAESDLPFKVDVVVWADINDHLRNIIRRDTVDVQTPEAGPASTPGPPSSADRLHLSATHRRVLEALLREHLPDVEVWACGSRVNGRSHTGSDLDLVLRGPGLEEIPAEQLADFADAVRESTIPFLVEARDWARLPQSFHLEIERDHVALGTPTGRLLDGKWCWPRVQLGAVTELLTGFPFKSEQYTDNHHAPRLLRGDNVAQGTLRWSGAKRWAAIATRVDAGYWLQEGDVVLAMDRPWIEAGLKYASVRRADLPALLVQRVARLRGSERLHTRFLHYVIGSRDFTQYVTSVQTGTAVPHISARQIKDFAFRLPSLSEQRAIVNILGTLDDKIELNRRMNETLEAMARALFKSWFVDFEPVRAKMEGRDTGLPRHIAELFPDRMIDSEHGEIPDGWHTRPLGDLIDVNPRRRLRKGQLAPYLDMASMPTKGHVPNSVVGRAFGSGMRFTNGDTLVARITPCLENGKAAFVDFLPNGETGWGSTEYIVMRPRNPLPHEFAYLLARSSTFREFAIQNMTGTSGRQRVQASAVKEYRLAQPAERVAVAFGDLVRPLTAKGSASAREACSLAGLRDTLLPKLVSGELRVSDRKSIVEAPNTPAS